MNRVAFTVVACAVSLIRAWAQAPQQSILDIEWENAVGYIDDLADPSKLVTSSSVASANIRNFMPLFSIGDIVSVNGKPAKGSWVLGGRIVQLVPGPLPGQAIGDLGRGAMVEVTFEILQNDGTSVGSIMTSGFTGGAAPPGLPGLFCNLAVIGGTGAFQGARGTIASPNFSTRPASMAEDPANRRINGGTHGHFLAYLIPMVRPEIVAIGGVPAVAHASDGKLVTPSSPAKTGEMLTLYATGLGPTRPPLEPGAVFSTNPLQTVNSPIEVSLRGQAAEVLYAGGYPGTTDGFQVNFRVPTGVAAGTTTLQLAAGFISSPAVNIAVQ